MSDRFNFHGVWAIYRTEMARTFRTVWQSIGKRPVWAAGTSVEGASGM